MTVSFFKPEVVEYIKSVTYKDPRYPPMLRAVPSAPAILYALGDVSLLGREAVAVVGTRTPTRHGTRVAHTVAAELARAGFIVVSGLARGIDRAAHLGALDAGGATLAVLPVALPAVYPPEHRALAVEIATRGGLLVSERRPGAGVARRHFVLRNRIQTGLSLAVVVVETGMSGGTMHTVRFAERQGRPIFCPMPSKGRHGGAGVRALLASGRARGFPIDHPDALLRKLAALRRSE